jgi:hypothetical protein
MYPRQNNPCWPLPPDYKQLTREGQRQARLAVTRDCTSAGAYIAGHLFFRRYYLAPQAEKFYGEGGLLRPAPGHIDMLRDFFLFPISVEAYTRGGGKTTIFARELPLREVVCFPYREVVVSHATEKLIGRKAESIMEQLQENARLIDDFGELVPRRASRKSFKKEFMHLLNGSILENLTIGSRQRGTRTSRYILDDPEYDPDSKVQERYTDLSARLENHIERVILPMLRPGHIKFFWIGTMLGARSYLYHVCFSKDLKFRSWNRRIQSGAIRDPETGKVIGTTWKERFSVEHLEFMRLTMGENFDAEFCNNPVKESARLLHIEHVPNEYTVDKVPPNLDERRAAHLPHPEAAMTYHYFTGYDDAGRKRWQIDSVLQRDYFAKLCKVLTLDYAKNRRSLSDLKCIGVSGFDARNVQWILDAWAGRIANLEEFIDLAIRIGAAWRVDIMAPETIAQQEFLVDTIRRRVYEGESEGLIPMDWRPIIIPVEYPQGMDDINKGYRIRTAFEYALPKGAVKFPASLRHKWPFNELYKQFKFFTPDLSELRYDDLIDTFTMPKYVRHGKGTAAPTKGVNPLEDMLTAIKKGKPYLEGHEGLVGMPTQQIRPEYLCALMKQQEARDERATMENANVWAEPVVVG